MAAAQARRLASPALRSLIARRLAELGGIALGLIGIAILVALASYDPHDPSLNTATVRAVSNLAGPMGAMLSDVLLQGFGLAAVLPGLAMLAWSWRIASGQGLGHVGPRSAALFVALPVLAAVLAALSARVGGIVWPTAAGLGGAIGAMLGNGALTAGRDVLGPIGVVFVAMTGIGLAAALTMLAFGLSGGEWRATVRALLSVATCSIAAARLAVGWVVRAVSGTGRRGVRGRAGEGAPPPRAPAERGESAMR
ncbi:MAG: DNA translocase FtsK 4TM domain-containing protein, partial [Acetobacteraceae bacterium]|nr:DNA translocase FtsK 4TM domain-containing protein [Acetobacteraceae bacterium]